MIGSGGKQGAGAPQRTAALVLLKLLHFQSGNSTSIRWELPHRCSTPILSTSDHLAAADAQHWMDDLDKDKSGGVTWEEYLNGMALPVIKASQHPLDHSHVVQMPAPLVVRTGLAVSRSLQHAAPVYMCVNA